MNASRFDRISKAFAARPSTQHAADSRPGASSRVTRQEATAAADTLPAPDADRGPTMLFVQTYQSGTITPKDGDDERYRLTLHSGSGQTVYFSNRPDRIVGSVATPQLLESLGFPDDNPPNAALVVETAPGQSDIAVVELFHPIYDPVSQGVTFEVAVLADWERSLELGFTEAPTDLAALAPSFSSARLFIDDCPDMLLECVNSADPNGSAIGALDRAFHDGFCWGPEIGACLPCAPWYSSSEIAFIHWSIECNRRFDSCQDECEPRSVCARGIGC